MLSLIVPIYLNEANLTALLAALAAMQARIEARFEAVFVVDGSPDKCYEILCRALPNQPFDSQLILLSRNFGAFAAVRAGLARATGDVFAVMAADLQEPPELVLKMADLLLADTADVVVGERNRRADPLLTRVFSAIFWKIYRAWVIPELPPGGVDVFACNRVFRDQLLQMREAHGSLIAQIFWMGYRRASVVYDRRPRLAGRSAWTFRKKVNYLVDSIFSVTDLPIRALTWTGGVTAALCAALGAAFLAGRLSGLIMWGGYGPVILAVIFCGALNLFGLGVVGSYAWRAYENSKNRPLHIPLRTHMFNRRAESGRVRTA